MKGNVVLALVCKFGSQMTALVDFRIVGDCILIPPALTGETVWIAIMPSAPNWEEWRDLVAQLSEGEAVDFDLGWSEVGIDGSSPQLRRWFLVPLPEAYHAALASESPMTPVLSVEREG